MSPNDRLVAVDGGDDVVLYSVRRGRVRQLGSTDTPDERSRLPLRAGQGTAVEYRLRPDLTLTRSVRLPAAGREYFRTILEHRLDRLTPWQPGEALFDFTAGAIDDDGQVVVDVVATSRSIADEADRQLKRFGLTATALSVAGGPVDVPAAIDFYRGARDPQRRRLRRSIRSWGIAAGLMLIPATAASLFFAHQQDAALAVVETRWIESRRALAAAAAGGTAHQRAAALLAAKQPETAVMVLIDELATVLPLDTHLERLELGEERVRLVGLSRNAVALIALLEESPRLADVGFAASVTREADGKDRFDLVATLLVPEADR